MGTTDTRGDSASPLDADGIIVRESAIHGRGAYVIHPFKKGRLGRYAPDIKPITTEEADMLPHQKQDYLLVD